MKFKCVGFERLCFNGHDLFIDDYVDKDDVFAKDCIVFYKKNNQFHFVSLGLFNVFYDFPPLSYAIKDIEEGGKINFDNIYIYKFCHNYTEKDFSVEIEPFYLRYEKVTNGNNLLFNCKNFCIGLNRNQTLVFNTFSSAKKFLKKNNLKDFILKINNLFKIGDKDNEFIRRSLQSNISETFVNGRLE